MTDDPREIELKFALPAERAAAFVAQCQPLAQAAPRALTSTYFDTPKRALRRAALALRVRREGEGFVQTLKDAGDGALVRGEWETRLASPEPLVDALAKTPAHRLLGKGVGLAPQFTVEVSRRSADVREGSGVIELSFDEGAASAGDRRATFAELELELKAGAISDLLALARKIAPTADLTLSFTSKAERGFDLAAPPRVRALKFAPPPLTEQMSAGEAFQAVARACLKQITGNAERLRVRAGPEVVHQARVGLRRLRSLITTFKGVVGDSRLPALTAELKWLTGELDAARNLDVLLHGDYRAALLQKENAEGLKGLGSRLRGARRIAYARAASAVESERFRRLLLDLLIWIEAGPWTGGAAKAHDRDRPVARFASRALDHRRRKILKAGAHVAQLDPAARHHVRIDAKKLRYAADAFAGLFGRKKRAQKFISALKAVQDCLGELNDIVVGEGLAHDVASGAGWAEAEAAFVAGRITGAHKARVAELLVKAQGSLDALADAKPFWRA